MMSTLSALTFDVLGHVPLDVMPENAYQVVERRVSRTRTLDGGASINDGGYSAADRIIEMRWDTESADQHEAVERLVELHPLLVVSTLSGVFLAAPERYTPGPKESRIRLLVKSKLSA